MPISLFFLHPPPQKKIPKNPAQELGDPLFHHEKEEVEWKVHPGREEITKISAPPLCKRPSSKPHVFPLTVKSFTEISECLKFEVLGTCVIGYLEFHFISHTVLFYPKSSNQVTPYKHTLQNMPLTPQNVVT